MYFSRFSMFLCILIPFTAWGMENEQDSKNQDYIALLKKYDANIKCYKKICENTARGEEYAQPLFDSYMCKAKAHFDLGEKDKQLSCYKEILNIQGLSRLNRARTHVNMSCVYLQLERIIPAAGCLQNAEKIASIDEIATVVGRAAEVYFIFADTYKKTAQEFNSTHPQKAIEYLLKALQVPKQDAHWCAIRHIDLAVLYDGLLKSQDSFDHAQQALACGLLAPSERDKALCYCALGSAGINQTESSFTYFEQIENLENLHKVEYFYLLNTIGSCYFNKREWDRGFTLRHTACAVLEPSSFYTLSTKYNLATAYGESGNKVKEKELYKECLDAIKRYSFSPSEQEEVQSIRVSIETFYFIEAMHEYEQDELPAEQSVEDESYIQKIAVEKEQKRDEEKKPGGIQEIYLTEALPLSIDTETDTEYEDVMGITEHPILPVLENDFVTSHAGTEKMPFDMQDKLVDLTTSPGIKLLKEETQTISPYTEIQKSLKIKRHGIAREPTHAISLKADSSKPVSLKLPKLGTRANAIFDQIVAEDWSFTREEYTHYLEDFKCTKRECKGSHRVFQLPKTHVITLKENGVEIQEHIFLSENDIKLGSAVLPAWKGKQIPFYLRKQLRALHEKIVNMYTTVAQLGLGATPDCIGEAGKTGC